MTLSDIEILGEGGAGFGVDVPDDPRPVGKRQKSVVARRPDLAAAEGARRGSGRALACSSCWCCSRSSARC